MRSLPAFVAASCLCLAGSCAPTSGPGGGPGRSSSGGNGGSIGGAGGGAAGAGAGGSETSGTAGSTGGAGGIDVAGSGGVGMAGAGNGAGGSQAGGVGGSLGGSGGGGISGAGTTGQGARGGSGGGERRRWDGRRTARRLQSRSGWKFIRQDVTGAQAVAFDDAAWTTVSTPHTYNDVDSLSRLANHSSGDTGTYRGPRLVSEALQDLRRATRAGK